MTAAPTPPDHLSEAAAAWFVAVCEEFALEDHHRKLLVLACESWDRNTRARAAIAEHGEVFQDRFGQPKTRPEVGIERDAKISFARLLRELALDVNEPGDSRPPTITGNADRRFDECHD